MTFDLRATDNGLFTRFTPLTDAGISAWRQMYLVDGHVVPTIHARSTVVQLRAAGYSVTTRRPARCSDAESDALLSDLGL